MELLLIIGGSSLNQNQLNTLISRIQRKTNEFIISKLKENGLNSISPSHSDVIFLLIETKKLTMKEISRKIDRKKNTVTVLIEKLITLGYVQKNICPSDKRVCYISLTEEGLLLKRIFFEISNELLIKTYSGLSIEDKENGIKFLNTVYENMCENHIGA